MEICQLNTNRIDSFQYLFRITYNQGRIVTGYCPRPNPGGLNLIPQDDIDSTFQGYMFIKRI
jgi:hypothetical protein